MGTRADFYIGRGEQAEWLGSIAWDGYPNGVFPDYPELFTAPPLTEMEFRGWLAGYLEERKDGTKPEQGWPWPWDDSRTTDYAYAYEDGKIYASYFGGKWYVVDLDAPGQGDPSAYLDEDGDLCYRNDDYDPKASRIKEVFPDMSHIKSPMFGGPRSGLMVIGIPDSE